MRKVYLDNLPRMNNKTISWKNSVGFKIKFEYDDIVGELNIIDYKTNGNSPQLYIEYDKNKNWITVNSLSHARINKIIKASIGHSKTTSTIGEKFGRLLVLEDSNQRTSCGGVKYKCLCDCGNYVIVSRSGLISGKTTSCGCYRVEKIRESHKRIQGIPCMPNRKYKTNEERYAHYVFRKIKQRAKTDNIDFSLTYDQVEKITQSKCYYCGIEKSNKMRIKKFIENYTYYYNGIDRIDSKQGYKIDNVVPCCKWCNQAKSTMSQFEFYHWIKRINKNFTYDKIS